MLKIFYRDPSENAAQGYLLDAVSGSAWGAIKAMHQMENTTADVTAEEVREAADECLRSFHGRDISESDDEIDVIVGALLESIGKPAAARYL